MDAIGTGDLTKVKLTPKDRELLKFVKLLTLTSSHTTDDDVQSMRDAGWTDEQIWETSLEVGIFSMLNRMADAYGLDYPTGGWFPQELRDKINSEKPPEKTDDPAPEK